MVETREPIYRLHRGATFQATEILLTVLTTLFDIFMTILWPELSYYGTRALVAILDIDEHVRRPGGEYTGSDTGDRQRF